MNIYLDFDKISGIEELEMSYMRSEDKVSAGSGQKFRLPFGFETDERGMIHWVYHQKLWRTAYIPAKMSLGCLAVGLISSALCYLITTNVSASVMIVGIMAGAAVAAFLIWAVAVLVMGGERCLKMAMDEESVSSARLPQASRWARTLGDAAMPYGIMSNDMRIVIEGLNRLTSGNKVSKFDSVSSIRVIGKHDCVSVKTGTTVNKIYARPEQLDFVADFITSHCPKAKIKR